MSKWRPSKCRRCGAVKTDDKPISRNGWCPPCGVMVAIEAATAMATRTGEHYDRHTTKRDAMSRGGHKGGVGGGTS